MEAEEEKGSVERPVHATTRRRGERLTLVVSLNGGVAGRECLDELLASNKSRHYSLVIAKQQKSLNE